jgi:hypothetical protein
VRRLLAGCGMPSSDAPHGEEGHADPDRGRRDGAGEEDAARVTELAAGGVPDCRDQVADRPVARQPRGETGLEARAGGERGERRAYQRGGVDQRRQLRPDGELPSGQEPIDRLIQAFCGRARGQAGSPRSVKGSSP